MTASLGDVRDAIADAVSGIEGLRCSPYMEDVVNPLAAMVDVEGPTQVTFGTAGAVEYLFTVLVFGQRVSAKATQKHFDELRDPFHSRSLARTLEADTALNALAGVDYALGLAANRTTNVTVGAVDYLIIEFPITVVIRQE
jgi:phosphoglycolate phosphatase-like HAD superfamily hydrolase